MDGHTAFAIFALVVAVASLIYTVKTGRKTKAIWLLKERERENIASLLQSAPTRNGKIADVPDAIYVDSGCH